MRESALYMIESGKALELVCAHVAEVRRVRARNAALCEELGVKRGTFCRETGRLLGVVFPGKAHKDFRQPDRRGVSYPRRGSAWAKRLLSEAGHVEVSRTIAHAFGVPVILSYSAEGCMGSRVIGHPLQPCGFLYLTGEGPFAMWVPDVAGEIADTELEGYSVAPAVKAFRMDFEGCRRIHKEEWDILVLQQRLQAKQDGEPIEDDDE